MDTVLHIGKSVIKSLIDYYEEVQWDDEAEYFPLLRVLISSIAVTDADNANKIEKELLEYAKQRYVSLWLKNAEEDNDKDIDLKKETQQAVRLFDKLINRNSNKSLQPTRNKPGG